MARKVKIRRRRGADWEPKIHYREDRGNWMVDLGTKFKPRKLYFPTEDEAINAAAQKKAEFLQRLAGQKQAIREKAPFNWFNLSPAQQGQMATVFTAVNGDVSRILRALAFFNKHTSSADASRKLNDVFKEYVAAKEAAGKRPRTMSDTLFKLNPFIEKFGERTLAEISTADIEAWLNDRKFVASSRNAYRRSICGLFNHAVKRRYIESNPATAIETVTIDQGLPDIHKVTQVRALLNAASNYIPSRYVVQARAADRKVLKGGLQPITDPVEIHKARSLIVPYLAIGYFAGLRPENELVNLDWKDVDFIAKTIRVSPATSKKRRQRYVDMSDNLIQWLAPYVQREGKIGYSRRVFKDVKTASKVEWSRDVMRHSFGSYLLAMNEDAPKTAMQMGHSGVDVLFNHYRNLVKKSEAVDYWNIVPEEGTKIIQMPIARAQ